MRNIVDEAAEKGLIMAGDAPARVSNAVIAETPRARA
jgi:hypothetical protein